MHNKDALCTFLHSAVSGGVAILSVLLQVIAKHGPNITAAALKDMTTIDIVIKESMRYQPIVPGMFRRALQTFSLMGYQIPKVRWHSDTTVMG